MALVDRLNAGEPYAVAFGGQGSAWLETLEELVSSAGIESELATLAGEAELLLEPVAAELVVVRPIGFEPLRWVRALAADEPVPTGKKLTSAAVSVPGVLLTQIAAVRALARQGMDLIATPPVALAGHSQGVLASRPSKRPAPGRPAAGPGPADRCRGHPGGAPARHLGARRPSADGLGDQRRPRTHLRAARGVRSGRSHGAAAGAVHPQRPAFGGHHRNSRAAVPVRVVLRQIAEEEAADRKSKVRGGTSSARCSTPFRSRSASTAAAVRRHRHRRRLGRGRGPRRRAGPRHDRRDPGSAGRLGRRGHRAEGRRSPVDPRPGTRRHPDPAHRAGDPRSRRRHRACGHPRRPAQSVHRRRRARGGQAVVELRPVGGDPARRIGQAVHQVHPAHRPLADPAGRHDARPRSTPRSSPRRPTPGTGPTGRRRPGHRGHLRQAHRRAGNPARARARDPVQLAVPRPVSVEAAARRQAPGPEGAPVRRPDRRRGRQRRHPRTRRGRRPDRRAQPRRHRSRVLQAGHRRADPLGHPDRRRGAHQAGHRPHRGRPRRRSPLLGGPRRPAAEHLLGVARPVQHHGLRRRRHRHARARRGVPVRPVVGGLRVPADAGRRHPGRHRRDGVPGVHHLARGQAASRRHRRHRPLGRGRKSVERHGIRAQPGSGPTSTRSTTPPPAAAGCSTRSPATPTRLPSAARRSSPRWRPPPSRTSATSPR